MIAAEQDLACMHLGQCRQRQVTRVTWPGKTCGEVSFELRQSELLVKRASSELVHAK